MWTLSLTRDFIIEFWKLDKFLKPIIIEDITDIRINADIIDEFENIEIVDEYDDSVVVPEHTVTYKIDRELQKVYVFKVNHKGIEQKLNGYRS